MYMNLTAPHEPRWALLPLEMIFMSFNVESSLNETTIGILRSGTRVGSELLANSLTPSAMSLVPADGRPHVLRLVAEVKMWVSVGSDPRPDQAPRRLMMAGSELYVKAIPRLRESWESEA